MTERMDKWRDERIELRCAGGPLLGVLVGGTAIEVRRGHRFFEIDLVRTLECGAPVILERVLYPEGTGERERRPRLNASSAVLE